MQRWEYRVVSLQAGRYTEALNEYGRDGWELVSVTTEVHDAPAPERSTGGLPLPRAFGRLEDAASKIGKLGAGEPAGEEATTSLLWILRRPLDED